MDDAPIGMREMLIHRGQHRVDRRIARGDHSIGVIGIPQIGPRRIVTIAQLARLDHPVSQPPLPAIGIGDQAPVIHASCCGWRRALPPRLPPIRSPAPIAAMPQLLNFAGSGVPSAPSARSLASAPRP